MDTSEIMHIVGMYNVRLTEMGLKSERCDTASRQVHNLSHVLWMTEQMRDMWSVMHSYDSSDERKAPAIEKLHRWFGFIQGCLYMEGIYTIDDMREHNRGVH